jgi:hypothetical protein
VGVRFGGSEHHRIETSSSHTRPPPFGVGTPGQQDRETRALRSAGDSVPTGQRVPASIGAGPRPNGARQTALFGALRVAPRGQKTPRSSEHGRHRSTGTRQPTLFGGSARQFHRDREPEALRSSRHPTPPGQVNPPHGTRQTALFGAPRAESHGMGPRPRSKADGTLRGVARCASTGQGTSGSSESSAPRLAGRDTPPLGVRQTALFGAPRVRPHRRRATVALRSNGDSASYGAIPRQHRTTRPSGQAGKASHGRESQVYVTRLGVWRSARTPTSVGHRAGQDGNGRKATATVMWYGCWRGEVFEGCEPRCGERTPTSRAAFGWSGESASVKRSEPLAGCGVQQTRDFSAEETVVVVRNHEGGT